MQIAARIARADTHSLQGKALTWRPGDAGDLPGEVLAAGDVAAHKAALEVLQRKFR